jgi:hypothetical protein
VEAFDGLKKCKMAVVVEILKKEDINIVEIFEKKPT